MTELEYSEIFKTFNINDDNFMMKYSDSYYTIVRSNFSYEFANMIYNKYHNKKYGIRINGEGFDTPHKNQNIYTYHIDTKEGLICFLSEYLDYKNKTDKNKKMINDKIYNINTNILYKINPRINMNKWIKNLTENENHTQIELRSLLDKFDYAVNPYINKDIPLEENEGLKLSGALHSDNYTLNFYGAFGCTSSYICKNKFSSSLDYKLSNEDYDTIYFLHQYCIRNAYDQLDEEIFSLSYDDSEGKYRNITYYISNGFVSYTSSSPKKMTDKDYDSLYKAIKYGTDLAKTITIDNIDMSKAKTLKKGR